MRGFLIGGRTAATAATANVAGAMLWNPSTARSIYVTQIGYSKTVAIADNLGLVRASARGATPTATITAVTQNDSEGGAAPRSGAVLDLGGFGTQPTLVSATAYMFRWNLVAAVGAGFILPLPDVIEIPAANGLVLVTPPAVILQPADVTFWWRE